MKASLILIITVVLMNLATVGCSTTTPGQDVTPVPDKISAPPPDKISTPAPDTDVPPVDDQKDEIDTLPIDENNGSDSAEGISDVQDPELVSDGFIIEQTRSDPNRPVRAQDGEYIGPIADTHAHLDPPPSGVINEEYLQMIVDTLDNAGVSSVMIMPVPNEGHMTNMSGYSGSEQRKNLRQIGEGKVKIFSGGEYTSNWLHDIYRSGYGNNELQEVLNKLTGDIDDPEISGIGEIGLYHFNKTGTQNIIEYPPTFEPFLEIIGLISERDVWIDLHAEPVDPEGESYEEQVFGGLDLLFTRFPDLKLILSHTAMTNPTNVRLILDVYPNVMMNFKPITNHSKWRNLEPVTNSDGLLYEDWAELFEEMPERFMIGTDEKFGRMKRGKPESQPADPSRYLESIIHMRKILGSISPEAAELIAYKNAERIFN